jgi:hypothetical protein
VAFLSRNLIEFDMCNTGLVDIIGRHSVQVPVATNLLWLAINFAPVVYSSGSTTQ